MIRPHTLSMLTIFALFIAPSMSIEQGWTAEAAGQSGPACDIRAFGAVGDDIEFDTVAIQAAIDDCAVTGGRVLVPSGKWLTGTLHLRSNIDFHLAGGATLMGSTSFDDYQPFSRDPKRTDPRRWYRAHIVGLGVKNVTISGQGTIDGQGEPFWEDHYAQGRPTIEQRPERQISFVDCHNVRVEDVTITRAAMWGLVYQDCDDVTTDGISVYNPADSPNTDGIVIRDTTEAIVTGVRIATGDDAIVVKSDDRFVENLLVTDSILQSDNAGLKFGTAGRTGIRNSLFENIIIHNTRDGIALYQIDGGSYLNNRFHNIRIETGGRTDRYYPIYVDVDVRREGGKLGVIEGLTFSQIDITSTGNIVISGNQGSPIRELFMQDISIRIPTGAFPLAETKAKPRGSRILKAASISEDYSRVPAQIVLANIEDLRLDNVRIRHRDRNMPRSAIWVHHVRDGQLARVDVSDAAAGQLPVLEFHEVEDVWVRDMRAPEGTSVFLKNLNGRADNVSLWNVDTAGAKTTVDGADVNLPLSSQE